MPEVSGLARAEGLAGLAGSSTFGPPQPATITTAAQTAAIRLNMGKH